MLERMPPTFYGGWLAILEVWCEQNSVAYQGVPVGTIKRHATGKGNAPKEAMMAPPAKARGFSPADDNEADAIAILLWAIETAEVRNEWMRFTPKATAARAGIRTR